MWQLVALGAVALLLLAGLIVLFAKGEKGEAKSGAVAKDDLKEAGAVVADQKRIMDGLSQPTPKGRKLLDMIEARRRRREAVKK